MQRRVTPTIQKGTAPAGQGDAPPGRLYGRIGRLPRLALIGLVRFYQLAISPHFPGSCRFRPTCSQYAILALRKYGVVRGTVLAVWRILRCNPWGGQGYDPPRWFGEPLRTQARADAAAHDASCSHHAADL